MKRLYTLLTAFLLLAAVLKAQTPQPEAEYKKIINTYTLLPDGSQTRRVEKELTLYTHTAMNRIYGETFITYDPRWQTVKINKSYTRQKDGTIIRTPANAFVEVLPASAADAPAYNDLKELVVVHTGLDLGSTIYLDYTITSRPGYLPALDILCPVKELSPINEFVCKITAPADKPLHYTAWNVQSQPVRTTKGDTQTVTYTLKNVAPRPYSYPYASDAFGLVQQIASGMMPAISATTWTSGSEALKNLSGQFQEGHAEAVRAKASELTADAGNDTARRLKQIDDYVHSLAVCGVSLSESGYRLRPASEIIRTAYGTEAELANLSYCLKKAAGLQAGIVTAALRPVQTSGNITGLSSLIAVADTAAASDQDLTAIRRLQDYLRITDLNGIPCTLSKKDSELTVNDTINVADSIYKPHAGTGLLVLSLKDNRNVESLYRYAGNTTITANILLPRLLNLTQTTTVRIPDGRRWLQRKNTRIQNPAGEVQITYALNGSVLTVTRRIVISRQLYTPSDYAELYALLAEWKDTNNQTVVLR